MISTTFTSPLPATGILLCLGLSFGASDISFEGNWFEHSVVSEGMTPMEAGDATATWINEAEVRTIIGYPDLAKNAGIEGKVVLSVKVNEWGYVEALEVKDSSHPLLEVACIEAMPNSRFEAARHDGRPVSSWSTMAFSFYSR